MSPIGRVVNVVKIIDATSVDTGWTLTDLGTILFLFIAATLQYILLVELLRYIFLLQNRYCNN